MIKKKKKLPLLPSSPKEDELAWNNFFLSIANNSLPSILYNSWEHLWGC